MYPLLCSHNRTLVASFSTCMFLSICPVCLSSGCTITFCIPREVWPLTRIVKLREFYSLLEKRSLWQPLGKLELANTFEVPAQLLFLGMFPFCFVRAISCNWLCCGVYTNILILYVLLYVCMCCLQTLFALCIFTLNMIEERAQQFLKPFLATWCV